ncbi:hypothetical protein [Fischerella thermalis]|jgi:ribosomal protein L37AE/L43A|uniref:Uncharacterized protein n=1 Tax=Fischerella thermalis JSC-11 TaxID=741277 RepID=G6FUH3_9CYAN|nr:hypothetical protein [Fischerella thermalis]EHC12903.1 hypothetical protein FJSC11DRAFT_2520 [Fischerella thermalis JSC-11]MBF1991220.1 hypothetical protein [Fischerella thermalis M58_A2018_009]
MNMRSNTCPCCGDSLLRHVRHGELYWFCQTCRQEVPLLSANINRLSSVVEKRVVAKD